MAPVSIAALLVALALVAFAALTAVGERRRGVSRGMVKEPRHAVDAVQVECRSRAGAHRQ
jgi:hypothetical protein